MQRRVMMLASGGTLLALGAWAQVPESIDPSLIPNYRLVRPGLAAAGQPSPEALAKLKSLGFKTVINLRTEAEGTKAEEEAVKAAGLRYVHVPMTAETFSPEDLRTVAAVLDDPDAGPVLMHCAASNRVGGVWAAIQAGRGKTLDEAEVEGKKAGLRSPAMIEAFRRVAAEAKKP